MHVSAVDKGTGKEQKIEIKSSSGLSEEEIKRMVKDAELHASEDAAKKELVEAKNNLEQIIFQTESSLTEHGDKISETDKEALQKALTVAKEKQNSTDLTTIKDAIQALSTAAAPIAQAMYQQQGQQQSAEQDAPQNDGGSSGKDDNVVDADFKVVDDDK